MRPLPHSSLEPRLLNYHVISRNLNTRASGFRPLIIKEPFFRLMPSSACKPFTRKVLSSHVTARLPCMQLEKTRHRGISIVIRISPSFIVVVFFFVFFCCYFAFNFIKQRSKRRPSPCLYLGAASLSIL